MARELDKMEKPKKEQFTYWNADEIMKRRDNVTKVFHPPFPSLISFHLPSPLPGKKLTAFIFFFKPK